MAKKKYKKRKVPKKYERPAVPIEFLELYKCKDCDKVFAATVTQYARCGNCSSDRYYEVAAAWETEGNVLFLDLESGLPIDPESDEDSN